MVASDDRGGQAVSRRWRFYETPAGRRPAREFLDRLDEEDRVSVVAAMTRVRRFGLSRARHLRGAIWEVRAEGQAATFRILFAPEGRSGRILLAIEGFSKKTQKTPPGLIDQAELRLADWRSRGST
jgi:phage-related protein